MTACLDGNTKSGFPGKAVLCSLYLYPRTWSALRMRISGFVSFLFMPAIMRLRVELSTTSDITLSVSSSSL